jgi:hypothetical protein
VNCWSLADVDALQAAELRVTELQTAKPPKLFRASATSRYADPQMEGILSGSRILGGISSLLSQSSGIPLGSADRGLCCRRSDSGSFDLDPSLFFDIRRSNGGAPVFEGASRQYTLMSCRRQFENRRLGSLVPWALAP